MSLIKFISPLTPTSTEVNGSRPEKDKETDESSKEKAVGDGKPMNNNNISDAPAATGVSGNKSVSGRKRFGENGFEEQGGYMNAKKSKLDNQFNTSTRVLNTDGLQTSKQGSEIFKGLSVYINGYTNPPEPELRELFIRHGGSFHPYHSLTNTTYVVATNLSATSKRLYAFKTVKPDWIMDSIARQKVLDPRDYMLYNLNEEKHQLTLSQFIRPKESSASVLKATDISNGASETVHTFDLNEICDKPESTGSENSDTSGNDSDDDEDEFFECSQVNTSPEKEHAVRPSSSTVEQSDVGKLTFDKPCEDFDRNKKEANQCPLAITSEKSPSKIDESLFETSVKISPSKTGKIKTATDEGFIEDFFGRSRLHLISEQKKEMQMLIGNLRKNLGAHDFPNLKKFREEIESRRNESNVNASSFSGTEVVLMHIDLDCFFVSVGLLSRPHLRGKPVVVTHSTGKTEDSKSDIACASYEARRFGVRNGMWVGDAKAVCPTLEVIPYDFEEYRRVSKQFFQAVATVTLDVEACSVDEMVVDATSILKNVPGSDPQNLAVFLRKIIFDETKCPASVGIGSNRLLAKLAVKVAKPDGVYYLKDCDAPSYIEKLNVRDLPGVGWSNKGKLRENFGVETCGDLLKIPLKDLKAVFGEKSAEKMHSQCKGIDTAEIKIGHDRPKSISVDVNFGIRFQKDGDVTNFLISICKELSNRAERIQAVSTNFTLKLLIRKKGAGEPLKQGGHGIVDCITRSRKLMNPTRNWQELYKIACALVRVMRIPPTDYRGIGVTLTDLLFDCDRTNKKSVQRTLTDMPVSSRAQKMLSLTQKKSKNSATALESTASANYHVAHNSGNADVDNNVAVSDTDDSTNANRNILHENIVAETISKNSLICGGAGVAKTSKQTLTSADQQLPVDINILRQLPREIAEEQCQVYGINKDLLDQVDETHDIKDDSSNQGGKDYETIETVDESFLLALPENIRQDVLLQLQEAKGIKSKVTETSPSIDDEQPCTSKQAMERSKRAEEREKSNTNNSNQSNYSEVNENQSKKVCENVSRGEEELLEEQTTPIVLYSSEKRDNVDKVQSTFSMNAKDFWDIDVDHFVLPPKKILMPALNNSMEVSDVRNLIRQGLEIIVDPTPNDVESLEMYFAELISNCWLEQLQALLKFLYRQTKQLPVNSKWKPILIKIIDDSQKKCHELYHGVLDLET